MTSGARRRAFSLRRRLFKAVVGSPRGHVSLDNVAIFPELDLVLNRIKKSGNTSLYLHLNDIAGAGPADLSRLASVKQARSVRDTALRHVARAGRMKSLVCIRNPYERALSAFVDKIGSARSDHFAGYAGFGDNSEAGFHSFLGDLSRRMDTGANQHFWPQTALLFQPIERFDFVVKLESLRADMVSVFGKIGRDPALADRFDTQHELEMRQPRKITGSASRLDLMSDRNRALVETLYRRDFEALPYGLQT